MQYLLEIKQNEKNSNLLQMLAIIEFHSIPIRGKIRSKMLTFFFLFLLFCKNSHFHYSVLISMQCYCIFLDNNLQFPTHRLNTIALISIKQIPNQIHLYWARQEFHSLFQFSSNSKKFYFLYLQGVTNFGQIDLSKFDKISIEKSLSTLEQEEGSQCAFRNQQNQVMVIIEFNCQCF